ncbi:MAG: SIR2 family NAD-dependent protein deacylase [Bacteroidota bacterium]
MADKKKLIVFTGAGMSQESGIQTFRDSGGLWEQYRVEDVATPEAWRKNPELVLNFYNERRKQILAARPNLGHKLLVTLEEKFEVKIITQNIDDLHERAGSTNVMHLHGEILLSRSTFNEKLTYKIKGSKITIGEKCEKGSQLRPHIVWFGEEVPMMASAIDLVSIADIFVVVGTSLNVYPAANLVQYAPQFCPKYLIDPGDFSGMQMGNFTHLKETASSGVQKLIDALDSLQGKAR